MNIPRPKIKIIFVLPGLYIGGAERFTIDLIKNLDWEKFEAKLILLEGVGKEAGEWEKELINKNVEIFILGKRKKKDKIKCLYRYYKILKREKPDIVHAQLFSADLYGRIAARLAGVTVFIVTEQNLNYVDSGLRVFLKRLTWTFVSKCVAISAAVKEYLESREKAPENKLSVIYNGVETDKFLFERKYANDGKIVIGSVGRLTRQKGFEYLIEAMNSVKEKNVECVIAGDGELKEELGKLIGKYGLSDKIKLSGWQNAAEFLKKIDIFVLASRWEGLGIAVMEAGLSGLPVVVSDIDGLKELVSDGQDGLRFKRGDADQLKEKINYLIDRPEERKRLGTALKEKFKNNFSIKKITAEYEKLYIDACVQAEGMPVFSLRNSPRPGRSSNSPRFKNSHSFSLFMLKIHKFNNFSALTIIKRHWRTSVRFLTWEKLKNIARAKVEQYFGKTELKSKPFFIKIEPTSRCNLSCEGCFHAADKKTLEKAGMIGDMDFALFKKIIDELEKYLVKVSLYSMGEPLLFKDIARMIGYLSQKNIGSVISSNLNFLTKDLARELVDTKLTHLIVSLDGYDEVSYTKYRKGGNFNKLMENLKMLQEEKIKAGSSYPRIEIQSLRFKDQTDEDILRVRSFAKSLKPDIFTLRDDYAIYLNSENKAKAGRCFWLYGHPQFRFDGMVQPCCFYYLDDNNNFGRAGNDRSVAEIWNNEKFRDAREYFQSGKKIGDLKCHNCDYFNPANYESKTNLRIL